ncbi:TolC family protein [Paenibacillus hamazuiensis]|uniref:TolC family protein n=1 Tax=Paenibacillus hamazuiensis TaxID=2936508 RepID=UPI00200FFDCF|nr:TolC family protein [Paenibacillus hamazuiensis]
MHHLTKLPRSVSIVILCAAVSLGSLAPAAPVRAERLLTLEQAVKAAVAGDPELAKMDPNIKQKKLELQQAQRAVRIQEEKDSSLFARQHSLNKDIELKLKVPLARSGWQQAMTEKLDKERAVRFQAEQLYLGALQAMQAADAARAKLAQANDAAEAMKAKLRFGAAASKDVDAALKEVQRAQSAQKQAELAYRAKRIELGQAIGMDLESGYTFELKPQHAVLTQETLWRMTQQAEKHDYTLYQDVEKRKQAEEKVRTIRALYKSKFGAGDVARIDAMAERPESADEAFMDEYGEMLERIKRKWEGIFLLPIPFIPIVLPIPKVVLQGEYDGLRYFEDLPNSLPVAMLERDKARMKENQTRVALVAKVKKSYLSAKAAEESYAQALAADEAAKRELGDAERKYKVGVVGIEELQSFRDAAEQAAKAVQGASAAYRVAIGQLHLDTAGGVGYRDGELPWKTIDSGLDAFKELPGDSQTVGSWTLTETVGTMMSELEIELGSGTPATDFAVRTAGGQTIGGKTKLGDKVKHLSFLFGDPSSLRIVLYQGETLLLEAELDGNGTGGLLKKAEPPGGAGEEDAP